MARPRSFDHEDVLRKIRDLFWSQGYQATSLADIMAATDLNKGSLYAAFGDKRAMYRAALQEYDRSEVESAIRLLQTYKDDGGEHSGIGPGLAAIARLFEIVVTDRAGEAGRNGCFMCNASADQSPDRHSESIICSSLERFAGAFRDALARAPDLALEEPERHGLAEMLLSIYVGMRVMARGGAPASTLNAARDAALQSLVCRA